MPKLLEELKSKHDEIYEIASKYGVSNIRVFGSVARGEENENSDVDLLIDMDLQKTKSGFDILRFERDLKNIFKRDVQAIREKALSYLIKEQVLAQCVPI